MNNKSTFPFIKMHGAGNDFILFDNRSIKLSNDDLTRLAPAICSRKFGVGSDGIIALQFDETKKADLVMCYKNPDGSDAGMCGNGARCFAAYAVTLGSPDKFTFRVHDKIYEAKIDSDSVIISFPLTTKVHEKSIANEAILEIYTNTEHIVCPVVVDKLEHSDLLIEKGRYLRNHEEFHPKGTNVNFISGIESDKLCLQTYERGVENLTLACGTGAIASAIGWHVLQDGKSGSFQYEVKVKGGTLYVHFSFDKEKEEYKNIKLEGPVSFVYTGAYYY
jgi:diaminopimelate epimerase